MEKKYTIKNHVIFGLVMKRPNIAKKCLEIILNKKITKLDYVESEKTEEISPDLHGVRFDVYCENEEAVYNIEVQAYEINDIGKRSRYYQDMMDMTIFEKGEQYESLKKNIVIFICTYDPFGQNRHLYTFENRCIQDFGLCLDDDTTKIILNTKGTLDDIPRELKLLLDYIETGAANDDYTKEIDSVVLEVQNDERWRRNIMTFEQVLKDATNAAAKEAIYDNKKETAIRMLQDGRFDDDTICSIANITMEQLSEIKQSLKE